jgi:hypothetical protein
MNEKNLMNNKYTSENRLWHTIKDTFVSVVEVKDIKKYIFLDTSNYNVYKLKTRKLFLNFHNFRGEAILSNFFYNIMGQDMVEELGY